MKTSSLLMVLFSCFSYLTKAQNEGTPAKIAPVYSSIDVTGSFGPETFGASIGYSRTHGLFSAKKIRIGYGVRASAIKGSNLPYISAPLRLTQDPNTIDTLQIGNPVNGNLAATIHLGYMINNKWEIGFNIDAFGIGFGSTNVATFQSSDNDGSFPQSVRATPTALSLLLVGDNDIGYLKSEFVVAYRPSDRLRIKAGADYTFSEYTTSQELINENDRFRYKAFMGYLGVSYFLER